MVAPVIRGTVAAGTRYCAGGGWMNHKRKGGTWRMSDGSVRGAGGQISVQ
ncbi:hypothetical protein Tco_1330779, partial [Tanacetum coccineum]